ncbi:MAG TPA: hypothetical protein VF041_19385 [Gemmatimonadaceae bacterium]
MIVLDAAGHETGVFGTRTATGIDATFPPFACLTADGGLQFVVPTVHFVQRY